MDVLEHALSLLFNSILCMLLNASCVLDILVSLACIISLVLLSVVIVDFETKRTL